MTKEKLHLVFKKQVNGKGGIRTSHSPSCCLAEWKGQWIFLFSCMHVFFPFFLFEAHFEVVGGDVLEKMSSTY